MLKESAREEWKLKGNLGEIIESLKYIFKNHWKIIVLICFATLNFFPNISQKSWIKSPFFVHGFWNWISFEDELKCWAQFSLWDRVKRETYLAQESRDFSFWFFPVIVLFTISLFASIFTGEV